MTVWLPAAKLAVEYVARPWAFSVRTPPTLLPSMMNWTVPLGMPVPLTGLTVAVNVTFCPKFDDGTRLLVTTVVALRLAGPTVWVIVGLVLAR
jgi:hypothetical protein